MLVDNRITSIKALCDLEGNVSFTFKKTASKRVALNRGKRGVCGATPMHCSPTLYSPQVNDLQRKDLKARYVHFKASVQHRSQI